MLLPGVNRAREVIQQLPSNKSYRDSPRSN